MAIYPGGMGLVRTASCWLAETVANALVSDRSRAGETGLERNGMVRFESQERLKNKTVVSDRLYLL